MAFLGHDHARRLALGGRREPAGRVVPRLAGDDVVGLSGLCRSPDGAVEDAGAGWWSGDWRRRVLAAALKQAKLAWAAANGVDEIATWTQTGQRRACGASTSGSATPTAASASPSAPISRSPEAAACTGAPRGARAPPSGLHWSRRVRRDVDKSYDRLWQAHLIRTWAQRRSAASTPSCGSPSSRPGRGQRHRRRGSRSTSSTRSAWRSRYRRRNEITSSAGSGCGAEGSPPSPRSHRAAPLIPRGSLAQPTRPVPCHLLADEVGEQQPNRGVLQRRERGGPCRRVLPEAARPLSVSVYTVRSRVLPGSPSRPVRERASRLGST